MLGHPLVNFTLEDHPKVLSNVSEPSLIRCLDHPNLAQREIVPIPQPNNYCNHQPFRWGGRV